MKIALRILAAVALVATIGFWVAKGSHRGFTINNVANYTSDPVTGLTGVTYEKGFIPGLDFLFLGVMIAGALSSASFLFRHKRSRGRKRSATQSRPS